MTGLNQTCSICLTSCPSLSYTCECSVAACTACFQQYVSAHCTTVAKCPGTCLREMTDAEVVAAFGRGGAQHLERIFASRVEEEDKQFVTDARLSLLPIAQRLLELVTVFPQCDAALEEATKLSAASYVEVVHSLECSFKRKVSVELLQSTARSLRSAFFPEPDFHRSVSLSVPGLMDISSAIMAYAMLRRPEVRSHLAKQLSGCAFTSAGWEDPLWRFACFFASVVHWNFKSQCEPSCKWHKTGCFGIVCGSETGTLFKIMDSHQVIEKTMTFFLSLSRESAAAQRCSTALKLFKDITYALSKPLAVPESANLDRFPNFKDSFLPRWTFVLDLPFYSRLWFDFEAVDIVRSASRPFPCGKEDCQGGFTSLDGKCYTCNSVFCVDCHEEVAAGHMCAKETKESILKLRSETQPCPRCRAPVFRWDGCDQMMCVLCHCVFLFSTGAAVQKGTMLHNPHYLEMSAEAKEAVRASLANRIEGGEEDIACIAMDNPQFHTRLMDNLVRTLAGELDTLMPQHFHQFRMHLLHFESRSRRVALDRARLLDSECYNRKWRLQYMIGHTLPVLTPKEGRIGKLTTKAYSREAYVRRLKSSANYRKKCLVEISRHQTVCDAARDMLIAFSYERKEETQAALLEALRKLGTSLGKRKAVSNGEEDD